MNDTLLQSRTDIGASESDGKLVLLQAPGEQPSLIRDCRRAAVTNLRLTRQPRRSNACGGQEGDHSEHRGCDSEHRQPHPHGQHGAGRVAEGVPREPPGRGATWGRAGITGRRGFRYRRHVCVRSCMHAGSKLVQQLQLRHHRQRRDVGKRRSGSSVPATCKWRAVERQESW